MGEKERMRKSPRVRSPGVVDKVVVVVCDGRLECKQTQFGTVILFICMDDDTE